MKLKKALAVLTAFLVVSGTALPVYADVIPEISQTQSAAWTPNMHLDDDGMLRWDNIPGWDELSDEGDGWKIFAHYELSVDGMDEPLYSVDIPYECLWDDEHQGTWTGKAEPAGVPIAALLELCRLHQYGEYPDNIVLTITGTDAESDEVYESEETFEYGPWNGSGISEEVSAPERLSSDGESVSWSAADGAVGYIYYFRGYEWEPYPDTPFWYTAGTEIWPDIRGSSTDDPDCFFFLHSVDADGNISAPAILSIGNKGTYEAELYYDADSGFITGENYPEPAEFSDDNDLQSVYRILGFDSGTELVIDDWWENRYDTETGASPDYTSIPFAALAARTVLKNGSELPSEGYAIVEAAPDYDNWDFKARNVYGYMSGSTFSDASAGISWYGLHAGTQNDDLAAPELTVYRYDGSISLLWDSIDNATAYLVSVTPSETPAQGVYVPEYEICVYNNISFSDELLSQWGSDTEFTVIAVAPDGSLSTAASISASDVSNTWDNEFEYDETTGVLSWAALPEGRSFSAYGIHSVYYLWYDGMHSDYGTWAESRYYGSAEEGSSAPYVILPAELAFDALLGAEVPDEVKITVSGGTEELGEKIGSGYYTYTNNGIGDIREDWCTESLRAMICDGDICLEWTPVDEAIAYIVQINAADQPDDLRGGITQDTSWTISADDLSQLEGNVTISVYAVDIDGRISESIILNIEDARASWDAKPDQDTLDTEGILAFTAIPEGADPSEGGTHSQYTVSCYDTTGHYIASQNAYSMYTEGGGSYDETVYVNMPLELAKEAAVEGTAIPSKIYLTISGGADDPADMHSTGHSYFEFSGGSYNEEIGVPDVERVTGDGNTDTIGFTWEPVEDAIGYIIRYSDSQDETVYAYTDSENYAAVGEELATELSTGGMIMVSAVDASGCYGSWGCVKFIEEIPAPVTITEAGYIGGKSFTFSTETEDALIYYVITKSNTTPQITTDDKYVENGGSFLQDEGFYGFLYAAAYKNGVWGEITRYEMKVAEVKKPEITVEGSTATISAATYNSYVLYTTDGTDPEIDNVQIKTNQDLMNAVKNGKLVKGTATLALPAGTITVKAMGVRVFMPNSSVTKATAEVKPPEVPIAKTTSVFGGKRIKFTCSDRNTVIYYNIGSSNITRSCKSVKSGESIFTKKPGAIYFKAYNIYTGWSKLGKCGINNVQLPAPKIVKTSDGVRIYSTAEKSYIVYTTDGTDPVVDNNTAKPKVINGTLVWKTDTRIAVPKGSTVKALVIRCGLVTSDVTEYQT